ncbi:kinase-like domain-containing protein [Mycotypha africana]|uniref:kinase-like domain-containing protein n=1 Tax=Mycotypha africana TaxID=64632 RepID=UPI002301D020|nr:kinase-like domain-containing protein [Mycotypha africana]KAI8988451.1 kinase-like domain-containing protein [Mycotypha africana]
MTQTEPIFENPHPTPVTMDVFGNTVKAANPAVLLDTNTNANVSSLFSSKTATTIAQQIDYQLSQLDPSTYSAENKGNNNSSNNNSTSTNSNNSNSSSSSPQQVIIDQSAVNSAEHVVEWSPNKRYTKLNTLLGKGAYKIVYKAMDLEEGYEVGASNNNKDVRLEIEILKSVRHPNIISFHDCWLSEENKGEFIFVTELMTSGTLREYIRKLNLPSLKIVKRWSRQILKGLAYLHGHSPPIIHRDIKCDNIFINGAHGEIKIGDLGTAENMWLDKKYTMIGTPEFMAPEMYEEDGYNEKVDLYAFGMCMIEMMTGEYPYAECTNTAQVYKKVCQHIKPDSLSKITNLEVLEVINSCLETNGADRLSAQELLELSFLAVEPEVVILEIDPLHTMITLQVVFKGSDRLAVKFEFNTEDDTAEEVVKEMIDEQVLPDRYQHLITNEINRILRDLEKDKEEDNDGTSSLLSTATGDRSSSSVWRRENDIRSELEKAKGELLQMIDRLDEAQTRCNTMEQQAILAEEKERHIIDEIEKAIAVLTAAKITSQEETAVQSTMLTTSSMAGYDIEPTSLSVVEASYINNSNGDSSKTHSKSLSNASNSSNNTDPTAMTTVTYENTIVSDEGDEVSASMDDYLRHMDLHKISRREYRDNTAIETFVHDTAKVANRDAHKAEQWIQKLRDQDIMTVGDLRELLDEDWAGIGLTVFAIRALKNMLQNSSVIVSNPSTSSSLTSNGPSTVPSSASEQSVASIIAT